MDVRDILPSGTILDRKYRIQRVLGAGGFGITYAAVDVGLNVPVAIKEYYPVDFAVRDHSKSVRPRTEAMRDMFVRQRASFQREARTLAQFDNPSIVRVLSVFEAYGTAYMVMRFEDGPSMKAWLASLGRMPTQEEMDRVLAPLLDALQEMHGQNFIHRDIAPDNIILRTDGSPVLLDFGSSRQIRDAASRSLTGIVKQGYSPPEQYVAGANVQGTWTDIYALGATIYRCVTGMLPPDAPLRLLDDQLASSLEAASAGRYRQTFLEAVDWSLRLRPGDRPQDLSKWRDMLLAGTSLDLDPPTAPSRPAAIGASDHRAHAAGRASDLPEARFGSTGQFATQPSKPWFSGRYTQPFANASRRGIALYSIAAVLMVGASALAFRAMDPGSESEVREATPKAPSVSWSPPFTGSASPQAFPQLPPSDADEVRRVAAEIQRQEALLVQQREAELALRAEVERQRLASEAQARREREQQAAAEVERQRLASEAQARREREHQAAAEVERQRLAAEAQARRERDQQAAAEVERQRLASEAQARREREQQAAAEVERQRLASEAQARREREQQAAAEVERQRLASLPRLPEERQADIPSQEVRGDRPDLEARLRRSVVLSEAQRFEFLKDVQSVLEALNCLPRQQKGNADATTDALAALKRDDPTVPSIQFAAATMGDVADWLAWHDSGGARVGCSTATRRLLDESQRERRQRLERKGREQQEAARERQKNKKRDAAKSQRVGTQRAAARDQRPVSPRRSGSGESGATRRGGGSAPSFKPSIGVSIGAGGITF